MDDLTAFLSARLDEDEAAAKTAADDGRFGGRPHWSAHGPGIVTDAEDQDWAVVDLTACIDDGSVAGHIARHDPARVLREVKAKRAILALHSPETGKHPDYCWHDLHMLPCPTLRPLAAVYSDHPDYRQEWKP